MGREKRFPAERLREILRDTRGQGSFSWMQGEQF